MANLNCLAKDGGQGLFNSGQDKKIYLVVSNANPGNVEQKKTN
tara:strand:+ start:205 stop:333 length:129 start_codon:yes stop_codon:yes gene_type:complete